MKSKTNCPNCGAPIQGSQCPYCGTVFLDFSAIDVTNSKPTYLKLKVDDNRFVIGRAFVEGCEMELTNDCINKVLISQSAHLRIDFDFVIDKDKNLYRVMEA